MSNKLSRLIETVKGMQSALLAYSGGVDSTFLLKAVQLSGIRALAVTAVSETMPKGDLLNARKMAKEIGIRHKMIKTRELGNKNFTKNPADRCFYCKDELFGKLKEVADKERYKFILDGSNYDDMNDWRPGRKAAKKYDVRSPLAEARLNKKTIRELSRKLNLSTWDKPPSPCLASRFPYGEHITSKALKQVSEAEKVLNALGFIEFRVRHHGDIARLELKEDAIEKILDPSIRKAIVKKLKSLGYRFISLDLEGFRSGRMNEGIKTHSGGHRNLPQ